MIKTIWRSEVANMYKGINAQTVADEIADIGDDVTAEQIVDKAKDENTELHKCFTWDDEVAYTDHVYSIEQIVNIINLAGFGLGIGSGRSSGYGRYEVVDFK